MAASWTLLHAGYADDRVASSVSLIVDGDRAIVVDPGMVPNVDAILRPLSAAGLTADDVTDVVLSHHHPDHTMNVALFRQARVHDVMATYQADVWLDRDDEELSAHVRLVPTPGHTPQDLSTFVSTQQGLIVLTHLWWMAEGPREDPFSADPATLTASRAQVLAAAPTLIVPGHGQPFAPDESTPR
jgi:glyoxylase-like metal-dependent hydrolase (beta-lactamase superfamily II)